MVKVRVGVVVDGPCDGIMIADDQYHYGFRDVELPVLPTVGTILTVSPVLPYDVYKNVVIGRLRLSDLCRSKHVKVVGCCLSGGLVYHDNGFDHRGREFDGVDSDGLVFDRDGWFDKDGVFNVWLSDIESSGFNDLLEVMCWLLMCCPGCDDIFSDVGGDIFSDDDQKVWDGFVVWFGLVSSVVPCC